MDIKRVPLVAALSNVDANSVHAFGNLVLGATDLVRVVGDQIRGENNGDPNNPLLVVSPPGDAVLADDLFVGDDLRADGFVLLGQATASSPSLFSNGDDITPVRSAMYVAGVGGPITIDTIADGDADNQILLLVGTNHINTVTVQDDFNTRLAGNMTLGLDETLLLIWAGNDRVEISRSTN